MINVLKHCKELVTIKKPDKLKIRKPRLPAKPAKPVKPTKYESPTPVGEIWHFEGCDNLEGDITAECNRGKFEINLHEGIVNFMPINEYYDAEMNSFKNKLQEWGERVKRFQPEINAYEAAKLEYDVAVLEWKAYEAKNRLEEKRRKVKLGSK